MKIFEEKPCEKFIYVFQSSKCKYTHILKEKIYHIFCVQLNIEKSFTIEQETDINNSPERHSGSRSSSSQRQQKAYFNMAFAAARMILKDKRRKSKEEFSTPTRQRSKVVHRITSHSYFRNMYFYLSVDLIII